MSIQLPLAAGASTSVTLAQGQSVNFSLVTGSGSFVATQGPVVMESRTMTAPCTLTAGPYTGTVMVAFSCASGQMTYEVGDDFNLLPVQGQSYTQAQFDAATAAATLIPGSTYFLNGAPVIATSTSTYTSIDGEANAINNETILAIGASTTARTCAIQGIDATTISISNNVISLRTTSTTTCRVGDRFRVAHYLTAAIEGEYRCISRATEGSGTRILGVLLNGLTLPNLAAGQVTNAGLSPDFIQLQHWSSAAGWPSVFQTLMGGRVRVIPLGTGSTIVSDWSANSFRLAQIASYGKNGAIIIDLLGNAVKSGAETSAQVLADMEALVQYCRPYARTIYIFQAPALTNENLASPTNTKIVANSVAYTCATLVNQGLEDFPKKYPFVRIVPIYAAEANNFGNSSYYTNWSVDLANGYALKETKADDGVHNQWDASMQWGRALATVAQQDFPFKGTDSVVSCNNQLTAQQPDIVGGVQYVKNLFEGTFYGTVAQGGGIPNSCNVTTNGAAGYTVTSAVKVAPDGGNDWIATIVSNGTLAGASTLFQQGYTGTANSLATQMNLARNKGVDYDLWFHCGVFGFNDSSMTALECVLEADYGDGQGVQPIASGFSTQGNFQAPSMTYQDSTKPSMSLGLYGPVRFPRFQIPTNVTLSSVQLRQSLKLKTGTDVGTMYVRLGAGTIIKPLT